MNENFDALIPTRQSLLSRLKNRHDEESWRVFFDTYWKLIYNVAIKAGLTDTEAQDIVQETVLSILKKIPEFRYDSKKGSFKGWLFQLTRWRIADHLRLKSLQEIVPAQNESSTSTETDPLERIANPQLEVEWDEEWEKNLFDVAVERVKEKIDPRQYQLFDLTFSKSWPVLKVVQTLGVSASKVYMAKHRVGKLIKKEIRRLQADPGLGVDKA